VDSVTRCDWAKKGLEEEGGGVVPWIKSAPKTDASANQSHDSLTNQGDSIWRSRKIAHNSFRRAVLDLAAAAAALS